VLSFYIFKEFIWKILKSLYKKYKGKLICKKSEDKYKESEEVNDEQITG
jgi:hypothetical protein